MPLWNFDLSIFFQKYILKDEKKLKTKSHPASNPKRKGRPYLSPSTIDPQPQSPFFTSLSPEIRIIIYELLFGNRSLHYECDWSEENMKWITYSYMCFTACERLDWDLCAGHGLNAPNSAIFWGMWLDIGILFSCWKGYIEGLSTLYATNEFRFSKQLDLCSTLPAQIPSSSLSMIRRLTLWWPMGSDIQPHVSKKNKADYDSLWSSIGSKFPRLTQLRIYIDSPYFASLEKMPEHAPDNEGDAKSLYIQNAWLGEMKAMVDAKENLVVFEVHLYVVVYRALKEKLKPWLMEKEKERSARNSAVRYKAYKCRSTAIKWQGCPGGSYDGCLTDISDGSSHIDIEHPQSRPYGFYIEKYREQKARKNQKLG